MKFVIILAILFGLFSCSTIETPSKPIVETTIKGELRTLISDVVKRSSCSRYKWKNRGVAPRSYINGMALMYAKQICGHGTNFIKPTRIMGTWHYNDRDIKHDDALAFYNVNGGALNTYTFLIGLGMRESSGRYGAGRDLSQGYVKGSSAEAGIFQMAYSAKLFHKELLPLYLEFKSGARSCELATFKDAKSSRTKPHESKDYGTGPGVAWQNLMKKCPAASVAWAAILIRARMAHFGPIKRKEVEFNNNCKTMLKEVEAIAMPRCGQLKK